MTEGDPEIIMLWFLFKAAYQLDNNQSLAAVWNSRSISRRPRDNAALCSLLRLRLLLITQINCFADTVKLGAN